MLEIAKIIDQKLQYLCLCNFTSYQCCVSFLFSFVAQLCAVMCSIVLPKLGSAHSPLGSGAWADFSAPAHKPSRLKWLWSGSEPAKPIFHCHFGQFFFSHYFPVSSGPLCSRNGSYRFVWVGMTQYEYFFSFGAAHWAQSQLLAS